MNLFEDAVTRDAILLGLIWLAYLLLHSVTASLWMKHKLARLFPHHTPWYRLGYNLFALITLTPPLWLLHQGHAVKLYALEGVYFWLVNALALLAIGGFFYSTRFYDSAEFLGLRQISEQEKNVEDQETFKLSPLHHYVRHPWYFFALVLIWTRDMNSLMMVTAILLSLYFIFGSRLEERKLIQYHGQVYREYMRYVPGVFPLPWKILSPSKARKLLELANARK